MMNNLFNAIVIVALLGTFLLAPTPQPAPPSVASRPPAKSIAVAPAIDGAAAKAAIEASGYSEVSGLTKDRRRHVARQGLFRQGGSSAPRRWQGQGIARLN